MTQDEIRNNIIDILLENTSWFEKVQEDLIHKGKFDDIADTIMAEFTMTSK